MLTLDVRIRDLVLFPILLVMFLQGLLRHYVAAAVSSSKRVVRVDQLVQGAPLLRSRALRRHAHLLTLEAFTGRKQAYTALALAPPPTTTTNTPMDEPPDMTNSMDMMKQSLLNMLPQMISFAWINYFFSGFVLIKLPFPLTEAFKSMLQRGINIQNLDPSYVSSLSWYFITLFGLRGLFAVVIGGENGKSYHHTVY
jgi:hypothetical protein